MRGKVLEMGTQILGGRITPAYAGKRTLTCCTSPAWEDHPRLCGEKEPIEPRELRIPGSPPPMRGKAEHFPTEIKRHRITPAYAGKSSSLPSVFATIMDHPRLCGEKHNCRSPALRPEGSPPPMRGKVEVMQIMTDLTRITPAYAGKSK